MEKLIGKTLVFTDQHFGIKSNSQLRQKIGALAIKNILKTVNAEKIPNIIFCGDYFHQRNALTVDTLNIAYRCLQALAKKCKIYMILGNHDLFNKNSVDVNSINIFRDIANVKVIDKPEEVLLNNKLALLVPWLSDLSGFRPESYDFLFGHFDISSKFLITSYVLEHSRTLVASDDIAIAISNDKDLGTSRNISSNDLGNMLGNFIDLAKIGGNIFAGHIHQHKEMNVKQRKFMFIGSPYEQNLGDIGCKCGYYVIDIDGKYSFIESQGLPKHIQFMSSEMKRIGIANYDFSAAAGNIVQKVYDEDISAEDDLEASKKITSFKPYEELLPDYRVTIDFSQDNSDQSHLAKMLKKSKFDYIHSYIDQLDDKMLKPLGIDKGKLESLMEKYYKAATGE